MALIKCTECGKEISDSAVSCPHCGYKASPSQMATQAKILTSQYIAALIILIIGVILLWSGTSFISDYTSDYWGNYLWESGEWKEDSQAVTAVIKITIGIVLIISFIIDIIVLYINANSLNCNRSKTTSSAEKNTPQISVAPPNWNSEYTPTWKRIQYEQENDTNN